MPPANDPVVSTHTAQDDVLSDPPPHSAANGANVSSETTPLLGPPRGSSLATAATPGQSVARKWTVRVLVGGLVALGLVVATVVPVVYFVYIPLRLQKGSGEGTIQLNNFHIDAIGNDSISIRLNATQFIREPPPVDILMSNVDFLLCNLGSPPPPSRRSRPSLIPPRIPVSWEDEDRYLGLPHETPPVVLSVPFPGLITPKNATAVQIVFAKPLERLDTSFISDFVTDALTFALASTTPNPGPPPKPFTFRQQGVPVMTIPNLGRWRIPMWTYLRYDPAPESFITSLLTPGGGIGATNPLDALNVTADDTNIAYDSITLPDGTVSQILAFNVTASFTNPLLVSLGSPAVPSADPYDPSSSPHILFSVFFEETRILRLRVHLGAPNTAVPDVAINLPVPSTLHLLPGERNLKALRILGKADYDGTEKLADWIGLYADGVDTELGVGEVEAKGFKEVPEWVVKMLGKWKFRVFVAGAQEEGILGKLVKEVGMMMKL